MTASTFIHITMNALPGALDVMPTECELSSCGNHFVALGDSKKEITYPKNRLYQAGSEDAINQVDGNLTSGFRCYGIIETSCRDQLEQAMRLSLSRAIHHSIAEHPDNPNVKAYRTLSFMLQEEVA